MNYTLNKASGGAKEKVTLNKAQISAFIGTLEKGIAKRQEEIDSADASEVMTLASQNKFAKELLAVVKNTNKGFVIESE